jgi:hypothetical protein
MIQVELEEASREAWGKGVGEDVERTTSNANGDNDYEKGRTKKASSRCQAPTPLGGAVLVTYERRTRLRPPSNR